MANPRRYHPRTEFRIELTTNKVRVFRIRHKSPDTEGKWRTVKSPEVDRANQLMRDGVADEEHTRAKVQVVLKQQYALRDRTRKKPAFTTGNMRLLERMWQEKYTKRRLRRMKRPEKSWADLQRAIEAAGARPLDTCDLEELADHLDEKFGDTPRKHARRITWINSILSWLGRPPLEQLEDWGRPRVKYLTEAEFQRVRDQLPDGFAQMLCTIAFYTGLRIGEIFAVRPEAVRSGYLVVESQMSEQEDAGKKKITSTKTGVTREAFVPDAVRPIVQKWAELSEVRREENRDRRWSAIVANACRKAMKKPGEPVDGMKVLTFHALRHCNAIWLLGKGANIHEVAQHLGNAVTVTERYYSGFELKKESIERLRALLQAPA